MTYYILNSDTINGIIKIKETFSTFEAAEKACKGYSDSRRKEMRQEVYESAYEEAIEKDEEKDEAHDIACEATEEVICESALFDAFVENLKGQEDLEEYFCVADDEQLALLSADYTI